MSTQFKVAQALLLTTIVTLFSFFGFLNGLNRGETWRIVCSSLGFVGFLVFTILLAIKFFEELRLKKLNK